MAFWGAGILNSYKIEVVRTAFLLTLNMAGIVLTWANLTEALPCIPRKSQIHVPRGTRHDLGGMQKLHGDYEENMEKLLLAI